MSMYPNPRDSRTPAERQRDEALINEAVAEDVAVGESIRAENERARANTFAADNARQASRLGEVRLERDYAQRDGAIARHDARSSAFAFWLLLGTVLVMLGIGSIWWANRPEPTASTTVINREVVTAPARTSTATSAAQPAQPATMPAPPPAPVIVERPVAVPVDRPVPVPVPVPVERQEAAPAPAPTSAPASDVQPESSSSEEPLRGYVEPSPAGDSDR